MRYGTGMNETPNADDPTLFQRARAALRHVKRRYLVAFIVAGLLADVAIVGGGLWWIGVFDPADAAAEARSALATCEKDGSVGTDDNVLEFCFESIRLATEDPEARRVAAHGEIAKRAVTQVRAVCGSVAGPDMLQRCADAPVVEGALPAIAVRTRVDALMRLADYPRLGDEGDRLIRYGDGFGYVARGLSHHAAKSFDLAARDYREAAKHFPDDPVLLDNLARAEVSAPPQ